MGQRIAQARKETGLSQQAVANRFGISRAAVAQWENGDTFPGSAKLEGLADVLRVSLEWLATGRGAKTATAAAEAAVEMGRLVPILGAAHAATWLDRAQPPPDGAERIATGLELGPRAFAFVIEDQSMTPEFTEGDKIILDPDVPPRGRDFVMAVVPPGDEVVFRMYRRHERGETETVELVPFNAAWPTQAIDVGMPGRIIATMVEHRRYRRR